MYLHKCVVTAAEIYFPGPADVGGSGTGGGAGDGSGGASARV